MWRLIERWGGAIQVQVPTHYEGVKALGERRPLIVVQPQVPTHCEFAKALWQPRQLIVAQVQGPTHFEGA